jgi:sulfide:quinone oxidoreductase
MGGAKRVLIVGGGVAAVETMLALRALAEERVEVELLAPEPYFWYAPLAVAEPFGHAPAHHFDLALLAQSCGALFTLAAAVALDPDRRTVQTIVGRTDSAEIAYDALVLATGARRRPAVAGALTFRGPADADAVRFVLDESEAGRARKLVFAVPSGVTWPLPAYELALQASRRLDGRAEITLVTPEEAPLALFGPPASAAVAQILRERRIAVRSGCDPEDAVAGTLRLASGERLPADRVVALPRLQGDPLLGVPSDAGGFIPVDDDGRVDGLDDVWAAGDGTDFPIKQGGIAAQQADAVAQDIAASAGADVEPEPFRPILRALLLTGDRPLYLRTDPSQPDDAKVADEPLWWPPAKIVGRYLAPFLAELASEQVEVAAATE